MATGEGEDCALMYRRGGWESQGWGKSVFEPAGEDEKCARPGGPQENAAQQGRSEEVVVVRKFSGPCDFYAECSWSCGVVLQTLGRSYCDIMTWEL